MEFAIQLLWLPALLGTRAFAQAFVIDPGENALQLIRSNGIACASAIPRRGAAAAPSWSRGGRAGRTPL